MECFESQSNLPLKNVFCELKEILIVDLARLIYEYYQPFQCKFWSKWMMTIKNHIAEYMCNEKFIALGIRTHCLFYDFDGKELGILRYLILGEYGSLRALLRNRIGFVEFGKEPFPLYQLYPWISDINKEDFPTYCSIEDFASTNEFAVWKLWTVFNYDLLKVATFVDNKLQDLGYIDYVPMDFLQLFIFDHSLWIVEKKSIKHYSLPSLLLFETYLFSLECNKPCTIWNSKILFFKKIDRVGQGKHIINYVNLQTMEKGYCFGEYIINNGKYLILFNEGLITVYQ
jgi:hypothetical protein